MDDIHGSRGVRGYSMFSLFGFADSLYNVGRIKRASHGRSDRQTSFMHWAIGPWKDGGETKRGALGSGEKPLRHPEWTRWLWQLQR